jgi:hypothetical protein
MLVAEATSAEVSKKLGENMEARSEIKSKKQKQSSQASHCLCPRKVSPLDGIEAN